MTSVQIRTATATDAPELVEMGRDFFDESPLAKLTEFDEATFQLTIINLLTQSTGGVVLVIDTGESLVGMAACVFYPLYFNMSAICSQEIFWFVKPEWRNGLGTALLDELERESARNGANIFMTASLSGNKDRALDRVYRRRGYTPSENSYIRKLSS